MLLIMLNMWRRLYLTVSPCMCVWQVSFSPNTLYICARNCDACTGRMFCHLRYFCYRTVFWFFLCNLVQFEYRVTLARAHNSRGIHCIAMSWIRPLGSSVHTLLTFAIAMIFSNTFCLKSYFVLLTWKLNLCLHLLCHWTTFLVNR
jgi:hypothetical protein